MERSKRPDYYAFLSNQIFKLFHKSETQDEDSEMKPTFSQFVQYILKETEKGDELDMHWIPVYTFCKPCQVCLKSTHFFKKVL